MKVRITRPLRVLICVLPTLLSLHSAWSAEPAAKQKVLPVPGQMFMIEGHPAFVILPTPDKLRANAPMPWVWYAPTFPNLPEDRERWMIERFQAAGIAVAGVDVGVSHGSPKGRAGFSAFYKQMVEQRGFSRQPALLARSQGGLMHYNWAAEHPEAVGCIAGIYPVGDLRSWPGLKAASGPYEMTVEQLEQQLAAHNPIDRLAPLAKAKVPLFHIHGNIDKLVPLDANSAMVASRYKELGGSMTLKIAEGQGHNYWSGFMKKHGIPINDLHGTVTRWDGYAGWKKGNDVHFNGTVYAMLAEQVAGKIVEELKIPGELCK